MSKWFRKYRHHTDAKLRLFCFPYAGGNAGVFEGWAERLPQWVDVFALQSPGRTVRFAEPPIASMPAKIALIADAIRPHLDVPHVFVGHSNGALTAFELARELRARGGSDLRHLILAADPAPHLPKGERIHDLPFARFVERLRTLKATPAELLENEEIMRVVEPMLRADFALAETHELTPAPPLDVPATLLCGEADEEVSRADMLAWRDHFTHDVPLITFPGDHFFIHSHRDEVVSCVRTIVTSA